MDKELVTIRFPSELLKKAKQLKDGKESFNELVVEALEQEVKRRKAKETHETIIKLRTKIQKRTGIHPDTLPLIRQLREGENDSL